MPTFNGKISLDIRDSEPDWAPYLPPKAPDGAPNVLFLAWDDLGYATMDIFGGPVECPTMRRIADAGVRFGNFHTTALCSPTACVAAHRSQRDEQRRWRRSPSSSSGSRGSRPASRSRTGSSPRCSPSTATTRTASASGTSRPARSATSPRTRVGGRSAAGSSASTATSAARPTRGIRTWCTTTTRSTRRPRPRRATTSPTTWPTASIEFIRDAKVIDPDKPFFLYLAPEAGHAPHHVPDGVGRQVQGDLRRGVRGDPRRHPRPPERARPAARRHRAVADQPARRARRAPVPTGKPWPLLDTVRPWDSLTRRRAASLHAHGRGVRRLHLVQRRPHRTRHRLPRGVGAARQHAHRRDLRQRRERRGRPERIVQRVAVLQRHARHHRDDAAAHRRARLAEVVQPLQHRLGVGARHAVPVLEALGRLRGRRRRHDVRVVAGEDRGVERRSVTSTSTRSTSSRRCTSCSASSPPTVLKGYPQSPIEGESFAAALDGPLGAGEGHAVLRDARPAVDLPPGLARLLDAPADLGVGQLRPRRVGALRPRARPIAVEEPRGAGARAARRAEEPLVLLRRHLQRPAPRRPHRARAGPGRASAWRARSRSSTRTTRTAPTCPSRRVS